MERKILDWTEKFFNRRVNQQSFSEWFSVTCNRLPEARVDRIVELAVSNRSI